MQGTLTGKVRKEQTDSLIDKTFFPGLNELRAIAILCVIPGHIEQLKSKFGLPYSYWFPIPGVLGVVLFFVLSGFLITALLIKEKEQVGTVCLKNFYARRILRIWPLYFLLLYLAIVVFNRWAFVQIPGVSEYLPYLLDLKTLILLVLVLPNFALAVPYAGHLWSIGIEEQFYALQPLVVKLTTGTQLLFLFMLGVLFLNELISALMPFFQFIQVGELAALFQDQTVYFGCIALGCIGAILCHAMPRLVQTAIHSRHVQAGSILAFLFFLAVINISGDEAAIDFRWHAAVFVIFVVNASTNDNSPFNLKSSLLDFLGRISYGMYIFHVICIGFSIALINYIFQNQISRVILDGLLYSLSLGFTILVATASYYFLERYFLGLKDRFGARSRGKPPTQP